MIPAISAGFDHSGGANDSGGGGGDDSGGGGGDDDDDNGWRWVVVAYIHSRRLMIIAFLAFQPQRRRSSDGQVHLFSSISESKRSRRQRLPRRLRNDISIWRRLLVL